jgi:hypothetical protein
MGGAGNCALPGPKSSPRAHFNRSSLSKLLGYWAITAGSLCYRFGLTYHPDPPRRKPAATIGHGKCIPLFGAASGFHLKFTAPAPYIDRQVKEMLK